MERLSRFLVIALLSATLFAHADPTATGGGVGGDRQCECGGDRSRGDRQTNSTTRYGSRPVPEILVGQRANLLRRPTGLAVGLVLKEPAPPPWWVRPKRLVPPLPTTHRAGIRLYRLSSRGSLHNSTAKCKDLLTIL